MRSEKRGGTEGSGEPLPSVILYIQTCISTGFYCSGSVIPILAFVTFSTTGEDEGAYYKGHDNDTDDNAPCP